jgi:N-acetylglucosamine kinase-like BadF-type ATPase
MILIADSGSTKTDWCIGSSIIIQTKGINPFHQSEEVIQQILTNELLPQMPEEVLIDAIYFYGAGCTPEKSPIIQRALSHCFPQSAVEVNSDLLGAARALCGKSPGIACILGTGSNSCFYDGHQITSNVSPLGYILGDEGSGAVLGKRLVGDCLKKQLPEDICHSFLNTFKLTAAQIIEKVYRQPQANRFLASLTPFLSAHRDIPEIQALLLSCFTEFFRRNVMQYAYEGAEVHFTGSIAWYFQEEVKKAAEALNIRTGQFIKNPIHGLINYHF